jgi:hypothetical protein
MSLLNGDKKVCVEQAAPRPTFSPGERPAQFKGRCYFCGDPAVGQWFCAAHLWAGDVPGVRANGIEHVTRYHAYWLKRFTPQQIVELAGCLEAA